MSWDEITVFYYLVLSYLLFPPSKYMWILVNHRNGFPHVILAIATSQTGRLGSSFTGIEEFGERFWIPFNNSLLLQETYCLLSIDKPQNSEYIFLGNQKSSSEALYMYREKQIAWTNEEEAFSSKESSHLEYCSYLPPWDLWVCRVNSQTDPSYWRAAHYISTIGNW